MPVTLNGEYYTMQETAKLLGLNYAGLGRLMDQRDDIVEILNIKLVPASAVDEMVQTYGKLTRSYELVADSLDADISEIEAIVAAGFPSFLDTKNNPGISSEHLPFLQAAYRHVKNMKRVSAKERPEVVKRLALKLMDTLDAENAD